MLVARTLGEIQMPHAEPGRDHPPGDPVPHADPRPDRAPLPRLAAGCLRPLLPHAEREEVLDELAAEYEDRARAGGRLAASAWLWRQVLASAPALARRGWWRGWSGFGPSADRFQPGGAMFERLGMDLRYSLRRLRSRPAYTLVSVLTLSLGVAGVAAVFSIARPLLLEPLPAEAEDEVVVFWNRFDWSEAEFLHVRPAMDRFRNVAAFTSGDVTLQPDGGPARHLPGVAATSELFQVLGASPLLGPGFRPEDEWQGAEPVVVLSHSLWQELGADPEIVGERIELAGVPRTVVGVMPRGFWFPDPSIRVWLSQTLDPEAQAGWFTLVGRMAPGVEIEAMGAQLERITALLGEAFQYPEQFDKTRDPELTPLRESLVGSVRPALLAMLGAMAVILLIASVNVAALMLGQVDTRGPELAVRSALGATREGLLRQILVETLTIGFLAGLAGAALAVLGFHFLLDALPLGNLAETATLGWTVFAAAIGIAMATASAVALVPATSVARGSPRERMSGSWTGGVSGRGGRLEGALVVTQVALVLLLASGAALLIRSVGNLGAIDPGVETEGAAVVDIVMAATTEAERRPLMLAEIAADVEALPGVASAAVVQRLPLRGGGDNWGLGIENQPDLGQVTTAFRMVTPDYFRAMGIEITAGRALLETDRYEQEEGVVVVNQAFVDRFFPGTDPIGQRIAFMDGRWDRVVGVAENVAETELTASPPPTRYVLYDHVPWIGVDHTVVVRTAGGADPIAVLDPARRAIQEAHPGVAVREVTTMDRVFTRAIGPARQVMALLALLGGLALVLGAVGVYGVVSHFVIRGKRDWGIRIALGLHPKKVVRQVLARGGALVGLGIVLGVIGFLALSRLLAGFLYGVGAADPLALVGAAALILAAGLAAAYLPAHRASRIDPILVLKEE